MSPLPIGYYSRYPRALSGVLRLDQKVLGFITGEARSLPVWSRETSGAGLPVD